MRLPDRFDKVAWIDADLLFLDPAWAARRDVLPLYDRHVVGSGDAMVVEAWTGPLGRRLSRMNEPMRRHFAEWAAAAR